MKKIMPIYIRISLIVLLIGIISLATIPMSGCALLESELSALKGSLIGRSFECQFFDNNGNKFMTAHGDKIDMSPNFVYETSYSSDGTSRTKTLSSVITITIDGSQIESCGSTILFIEDGLTMDVDFNLEEMKDIESDSDGFTDNTSIAAIVNQYKNYFGKSSVVVIQSQLGDPICAFSGEDVYWEVCQDLPKTTKLMIDGKALYIHRANFQIVDKDLLE